MKEGGIVVRGREGGRGGGVFTHREDVEGWRTVFNERI